MTDRDASLEAAFTGEGATLRLLWPHWQGAGAACVRELASEFPFDDPGR